MYYDLYRGIYTVHAQESSCGLRMILSYNVMYIRHFLINILQNYWQNRGCISVLVGHKNNFNFIFGCDNMIIKCMHMSTLSMKSYKNLTQIPHTQQKKVVNETDQIL